MLKKCYGHSAQPATAASALPPALAMPPAGYSDSALLSFGVWGTSCKEALTFFCLTRVWCWRVAACLRLINSADSSQNFNANMFSAWPLVLRLVQTCSATASKRSLCFPKNTVHRVDAYTVCCRDKLPLNCPKGGPSSRGEKRHIRYHGIKNAIFFFFSDAS